MTTNSRLNELFSSIKEQLEAMERTKNELINNATEQNSITNTIKIQELKNKEHVLWHQIFEQGQVVQNTRNQILEYYPDANDCWLEDIDKEYPGLYKRYCEMRSFMDDVYNIIAIQMWKNEHKDR